MRTLYCVNLVKLDTCFLRITFPLRFGQKCRHPGNLCWMSLCSDAMTGRRMQAHPHAHCPCPPLLCSSDLVSQQWPHPTTRGLVGVAVQTYSLPHSLSLAVLFWWPNVCGCVDGLASASSYPPASLQDLPFPGFSSSPVRSNS